MKLCCHLELMGISKEKKWKISTLKGLWQIPTQENYNGVHISPKGLWLLGMERKTNSIGPVKVAERLLAGQRQKGNNEAEHPNPKKYRDGSSPARRQVSERVDDADVFLQGEISEEEDRYLCGQHGQRTNDLTLSAVHPCLRMPVVLATVLQIISTNHEKVDPHQSVCTCR